jgi:hypothetical protein
MQRSATLLEKKKEAQKPGDDCPSFFIHLGDRRRGERGRMARLSALSMPLLATAVHLPVGSLMGFVLFFFMRVALRVPLFPPHTPPVKTQFCLCFTHETW